MFLFACMGWRRVAIVAKHSVAVSALMGWRPCPEELFICGSQEKAPAGEIPDIYLLSHSLQDAGVFPPLRWASCHLTDGSSVSHGICQIKCCFHLYAPPLEKRHAYRHASLSLKPFFRGVTLLGPCTSSFCKSSLYCKKSSSQFT